MPSEETEPKMDNGSKYLQAPRVHTGPRQRRVFRHERLSHTFESPYGTKHCTRIPCALRPRDHTRARPRSQTPTSLRRRTT